MRSSDRCCWPSASSGPRPAWSSSSACWARFTGSRCRSASSCTWCPRTPAPAADVTLAVTHGLTEALAGMAVAFSNSLVGILSAVVLTVLGVLSNVTDRRTALMVQLETYLDRLLPDAALVRRDAATPFAAFGESVARLEGAVVRFESALRHFAASTKDLREVHLVVALKPGDGR